jgi:hypothetical protein
MVSQAKAMSVPVPAVNAQLGSFEKKPALAMLGAIFESMERTSGGDARRASPQLRMLDLMNLGPSKSVQ